MRWTLLVLLVALSGCEELDDGARRDFARRYGCSGDQVKVNARPDLSPKKLLGSDRVVGDDPARYEDSKAYEAAGCGQHAILVCYHPRTGRRSRVDCEFADR